MCRVKSIVIYAKTIMRRTILYICLFAISLFAHRANAQSVVVNAEIDSVQRLIGQQARIKLKVSCDAGKRVVMPAYSDELLEGIEILEMNSDTQYLNDGKRETLTHEYVVTSFDTALYVIPPFEVLVEGEPYYSQELAMAVYTFPVDTTNIDQFFGPKDNWQIKLTWSDVRSSVIYFVLLLLLGLLLAWVIVRYVNNKPIIRIVKIKPKLPAHVVALNQINKIKEDNSWRTSGSSKDYYTALTDALRVYFGERFGFNATEMTTSEIVENLLKIKDKESIAELHEILLTADLVKFAKFNPPMNENDRNLVNAIEFINETKIDGLDENPQPTEKKVVNKRSEREKLILLLSIILLSVVAVGLLVMFILDLYYLLS